MTTEQTTNCHFCGVNHPFSALKKWYLPPVLVSRDEDGDGLYESEIVPICNPCREKKLAGQKAGQT